MWFAAWWLSACGGAERVPAPSAGGVAIVFGSRGEGEIEPCG